MATGKMPFDGASSGEICGAILRDEPKLPSQVNRQVSPGLEAVIRKALEKDRNLRYQHESEMRTDLQRLKRDTDSSRQVPTAKGHANAVPAAAQPAHSSSSSVVIEVAKRHKWTVASGLVAVLIVLAAAAIGIYSLLHRPQPTPFQNFTIKQVTSSGKAAAAAISPDGKYVLNIQDDNGQQTLEASSGGTLELIGSYTNTGGIIQALTGSTVELNGASIANGTLATTGTGVGCTSWKSMRRAGRCPSPATANICYSRRSMSSPAT